MTVVAVLPVRPVRGRPSSVRTLDVDLVAILAHYKRLKFLELPSL